MLTDLQKLRVVDLKKELERLDLSTTGVKAVLVQRIFDYYQVSKEFIISNSVGQDPELTDRRSTLLETVRVVEEKH